MREPASADGSILQPDPDAAEQWGARQAVRLSIVQKDSVERAGAKGCRGPHETDQVHLVQVRSLLAAVASREDAAAQACLARLAYSGQQAGPEWSCWAEP